MIICLKSEIKRKKEYNGNTGAVKWHLAIKQTIKEHPLIIITNPLVFLCVGLTAIIESLI